MLPFSITNRLTIGDYTRILLKKTFKRPAMIFLSLLGIISLIVYILSLAGIVPAATRDWFPWVFILFPFVIPLITIYKARAIYKASRRMKEGVFYTFSEDSLYAKAVDSEWTYNWDTIIHFEETRDLLLLYPTKTSAEIIKKEYLSPEQIDFIRIKTGKYAI
jgi:hypothetical protein